MFPLLTLMWVSVDHARDDVMAMTIQTASRGVGSSNYRPKCRGQSRDGAVARGMTPAGRRRGARQAAPAAAVHAVMGEAVEARF
ncbi:hypothetical protein LIER_07643 [Lithospermum erythrorhizon]|uniref:Secreted protein n=1 Tax=Lithospermum erythrorhizon TaxID=34254 RepID=A0AAV3P977_LITER